MVIENNLFTFRCHVADTSERFVFSLLLLYLIKITFNFIQPTGTSTKFDNMTERALQHFEDEHGVKLEKIAKIPLEGDDTIDKRWKGMLSFAS